jgi:2-polyprenyl-3-methyl-5-hydroxy-6-metoxy-1,4-benzoquinol methylase
MKNIIQKTIFNHKYEEHKGDISELLVDLHLRQKLGLSWYPRALYEDIFMFNERMLTVSTRSSVLDVGCGVGASMISFVKAGANVLGIDFSAEGIKRARSIFGKAGEKKVSFKKADFFTLHKDRKRYDVISLQTFMEHMENMEQASRVLRTTKTLLKPGLAC